MAGISGWCVVRRAGWCVHLGVRTVRATWHNKPSSKNKHEEMVITIGQPNYKERKFIAKCALECVKLPTKTVLKDWPKKK